MASYDLTFPLGGVDRTLSYELQPNGTTPDALNVLPFDVYAERARGGTRLGMSRFYSEVVALGTPVRTVFPMVKADGTPVLVYTGNNVAGAISNGIQYGSGGGLVALGAGRTCWTVLEDRAYFTSATGTQPYYFDATTGAFAAHANAPASPLGDVPTNVKICAGFLSRLWFAGKNTAQRAYYASRVGEPNDFQYNDTDEGSAFFGALDVAGGFNDNLTAIIPWYGDYALFCGSSSSTICAGDPEDDGYFYNVTNRYGCLDSMSWCKGPDKTLYVMTRDGLALWTSPTDEPEILSNSKIPQEFPGIDKDVHELSMVYDTRQSGIHIFKTRTTYTSGGGHWFYDLRGKGFWPQTYSSECEPFSACQYQDLNSTESSILMGGRNGYIRYFDGTQADDDGTNFESYCFIGPQAHSESGREGKLKECSVTMTRTSGDANVSVHPGRNAEDAFNASAEYDFNVSAGANDWEDVQVLGVTSFFKIYGTAGTRWGLEGIHMKPKQVGKARM